MEDAEVNFESDDESETAGVDIAEPLLKATSNAACMNVVELGLADTDFAQERNETSPTCSIQGVDH